MEGLRVIPAPADKKPAVLIVDDQEAVRQMFYLALRARGVACWVAGGTDVAVEILSEHAGEICCALVDVNMPAVDGLATIAKLRAIKPDLSCFLLTSSGMVDESAFLASGAVGVLPKPFTIDEMHGVLTRLCDAR